MILARIENILIISICIIAAITATGGVIFRGLSIKYYVLIVTFLISCFLFSITELFSKEKISLSLFKINKNIVQELIFLISSFLFAFSLIGVAIFVETKRLFQIIIVSFGIFLILGSLATLISRIKAPHNIPKDQLQIVELKFSCVKKKLNIFIVTTLFLVFLLYLLLFRQ